MLPSGLIDVLSNIRLGDFKFDTQSRAVKHILKLLEFNGNCTRLIENRLVILDCFYN